MGKLRYACVSLLLLALPAFAFTLETAATAGCHEHITLQAVEAAGWGTVPPETTAADRALAENLPFTLPKRWDPWTLALLIGDRDNDLHGAAVTDLVTHPWEDYSDEDQRSHCLRSTPQQNAVGDAEALSDCQGFIRRELELAMAAPIEDTVAIPVALRFETATVTVAARPYHLGQALHAMQDSFAHTYRSPDFTHVLSVFNYVSPVLSAHYVESRDGHAHQSELDHCDGQSAFEKARVQAAIDASAQLLRAAQVPAVQGPSAVQDALDAWLSFSPGCTAENGWCLAEQRYAATEHAVGCSTVGGDLTWWSVAVVLLLLVRGRRPVTVRVRTARRSPSSPRSPRS